ncbi:AAA family ATPase [Thermostilla marina]
MYEEHFGFQRRPFPAACDCDLYVLVEPFDEALERLTRTIARAEGVGLVVGPTGTGKSLLCRLLIEQFRDRMEICHLAGGRLGRPRLLLQALLFALGQPYRGMDDGELRLALDAYLTRRPFEYEAVLVIVDEAHTLPQRVLEELRLLLNLTVDDQPRVRMVLAGGSALEERLASPRLEAFSQRITARCYLDALSFAETKAYVRGQVDAAGGDGARVFPGEAVEAIYQATGGVPRLINQLADHALVTAFAEGMESVSRHAVEWAWADLQQLPTPFHEAAPSSSASTGGSASTIEFGSLQDDFDETLETASERVEQVIEEESAAVVEFGSLDDEDDASHASADEPSTDLAEVDPPVSPTRTAHEEFVAATPTERLEMAEAAIESLQEDYEPESHERHSELEVIFEDWGNPFEEQFEEEVPVAVRGTDRTAAGTPEDSGAVSHVPNPVVKTRAKAPSEAVDGQSMPLAEHAPAPPTVKTPAEPSIVASEVSDFAPVEMTVGPVAGDLPLDAVCVSASTPTLGDGDDTVGGESLDTLAPVEPLAEFTSLDVPEIGQVSQEVAPVARADTKESDRNAASEKEASERRSEDAAEERARVLRIVANVEDDDRFPAGKRAVRRREFGRLFSRLRRIS